MTATTIQIDGVSKRFGNFNAVRNVSLTLPAGETVALVGHNGAGKTTLMKMMLGLIRPTEGTVHVLGEDPASGKFAARTQLGYLPETVAFNAALTGRETIAFYASLKRQSSARGYKLLERVGLGAAVHRRVGTYSKGMRQRLGLAQALLGEPRVMLLDEPTTGLDPALRQSFYELVRDLRDAGATVLLSSHALTELEERTDRVVIMNRGLMVANGTIEDLRNIARLPVRIRVSVDDLSKLPDWIQKAERLNNHSVEFNVTHENKIAAVQHATVIPGLRDLDMVPPTLDDLYAHFLLTQDEAA